MTREERIRGVRRLAELADKTDLNVKNQLAVYWHKELKELERSTGHHEGEIERSLNDSYFIYQTILDRFSDLPPKFTSADVQNLDFNMKMMSGKKICNVLMGMCDRGEIKFSGKLNQKKRKIFLKIEDEEIT